jgi:hypothetical protein
MKATEANKKKGEGRDTYSTLKKEEKGERKTCRDGAGHGDGVLERVP